LECGIVAISFAFTKSVRLQAGDRGGEDCDWEARPGEGEDRRTGADPARTRAGGGAGGRRGRALAQSCRCSQSYETGVHASPDRLCAAASSRAPSELAGVAPAVCPVSSSGPRARRRRCGWPGTAGSFVAASLSPAIQPGFGTRTRGSSGGVGSRSRGGVLSSRWKRSGSRARRACRRGTSMWEGVSPQGGGRCPRLMRTTLLLTETARGRR
jgi:hypothetical protein